MARSSVAYAAVQPRQFNQRLAIDRDGRRAVGRICRRSFPVISLQNTIAVAVAHQAAAAHEGTPP
jgi:hypothetical protein